MNLDLWSSQTSLRIWDVFFSEGTTVLFQVAIALIFIVKEVILHAKKPDDISSTLSLLKVCALVRQAD